MGYCSTLRASLAVIALLSSTATALHALVSLNDGNDELFLNSTINVGYDSNIFDHAGGAGDTTYSMILGADYARRDGWIGLNALGSVNFTRYADHAGENFADPALHIELTKQTGRTTGSLTVGAAREDQADVIVNLRTESWLYDAALKFKYPVIERYSISGNLGYGLQDFTDNSQLVDLTTYTAGTDLAYSLSTDRDLLVGYRFREEKTSADVQNFDHSLNVGLSGRLIYRLKGSISAGYSHRIPLGTTDHPYNSWTANASTSWDFTKRFILRGELSKDFSTTASNLSADTLATRLRAAYTMNSKVVCSTGTGWADSHFLGQAGGARHDNNWNWDADVKYILSDHMSVSLIYRFLQNWSTLPLADFVRHDVSLSLTARF
jgi:hypothetical protein